MSRAVPVLPLCAIKYVTGRPLHLPSVTVELALVRGLEVPGSKLDPKVDYLEIVCGFIWSFKQITVYNIKVGHVCFSILFRINYLLLILF